MREYDGDSRRIPYDAMVDPEPAEGCPVCGSDAVESFLTIAPMDYWRCQRCEARFLDRHQRPSGDAEYAHYLHHQNGIEDAAYRHFLSKLADPLLERLSTKSEGLDYGCGPGPALAAMLREAGHKVALYDPFFHPDLAALRRDYDFITSTEVAEHFHRPAEEFDRLMTLIRPGGWLAIMTCFQTDDADFRNWHYRLDPTHVVFYREATLRHIAACRGLSCDIPVKNVALMRKPSLQQRESAVHDDGAAISLF